MNTEFAEPEESTSDCIWYIHAGLYYVLASRKGWVLLMNLRKKQTNKKPPPTHPKQNKNNNKRPQTTTKSFYQHFPPPTHRRDFPSSYLEEELIDMLFYIVMLSATALVLCHLSYWITQCYLAKSKHRYIPGYSNTWQSYSCFRTCTSFSLFPVTINGKVAHR